MTEILRPLPADPFKRAVFLLLAQLGGVVLAYDILAPLARVIARGVAHYIAARIKVMTLVSVGTAGQVPRVLVFSAFRFWEDRDLLTATSGLALLEAPTSALQAVNALFRTRAPEVQREIGTYAMESNPAVLRERERLVDFIAMILPYLHQLVAFDAILTPAVFYEYEIPWARAATRIGMPFIGLHKEFTVLSHKNMLQRVDRFIAQRRRFHGSKVLVVNQRAKELFVRSGVAEAERIEVVGLPRMDRLFDPASPFRNKKSGGRQVVLFSFGHYSGDLHPGDKRSKLFSRRDHEGFVRLFDEVHGAMGVLAQRHPDVRFAIKPKNVEHWWICEIERAIAQATNSNPHDFPNLAIVRESAQELIRDSDAVIAFNSTALLEARILDRPTIMPLFAEAVDRYPDNIYLKEEKDLFHVADSRESLERFVEAILAGELGPAVVAPDREREIMCEFLGYDDAKSTERVVKSIRRAVQEAGR